MSDLILEPEKFIGKERPDEKTIVKFYCTLCGKKCWHKIKQPVSSCHDIDCKCAGHMAVVKYVPTCEVCGWQLFDYSKCPDYFEDESEEKLLGYHHQKWNELGLKCKEDLQKRIFQMYARSQCDDAFDPNDELANNEWCKYVRGIEKYAGTSPGQRSNV